MSKSKTRIKTGQKTITSVQKAGGVLVTTTVTTKVESATVPYTDILDACEVVYDEDSSEAPWERCDGLEHTATPADKMPDEADIDAMQGHVWRAGWNEYFVVTVDKATVKSWGVYDYARANGASKQVAREIEAFNLRQTIEQICNYYKNDWSYYGVKCEFKGVNDSVWGIDDEDYAEHEVRHDIASQVAHDLEKKGFTVTGKPPATSSYAKLWNLRRKATSQNWGRDAEFDYAENERQRMAAAKK